MADQRGRDDPPLFYLPTQLAEFKYHALLIRSVWIATKLLTDLHPSLQTTRAVEGEYSVRRPRGIYGFMTIELRDKFCRQCTAAEDSEEPICFPVTIPNVYMDEPYSTTIRYQSASDTAPVSEPSTEENPK